MIKKLIIILIIIIVILAVILLFKSDKEEPLPQQQSPQSQAPAYEPEFLSDLEKIELGLETELEIQALKRNEEGKVEIYKIIRNQTEVVTDPNQVGPISPYQR